MLIFRAWVDITGDKLDGGKEIWMYDEERVLDDDDVGHIVDKWDDRKRVRIDWWVTHRSSRRVAD